jgi:hypothetical protein
MDPRFQRLNLAEASYTQMKEFNDKLTNKPMFKLIHILSHCIIVQKCSFTEN